MSDQTIEVSIDTLLTITTGRMLAESFGDFHRAADTLMGQPLMTHQFASERLSNDMRREAIRQHPWLARIDFPADEFGDASDKEAFCRKWVALMGMTHGKTHTITAPPETRHVPLIEGLPAKFGGAS